MKTISCKDLGINCPWVGRADNIYKLMEMATKHAVKRHNYYWDNRLNMLSEEELKKIMISHVRDD